MSKIDITMHNDDELWNAVQNDEWLSELLDECIELDRYNTVRSSIDETFIYTKEQLQEFNDEFDRCREAITNNQ